MGIIRMQTVKMVRKWDGRDVQRLTAKPHLTEEVSVEELILEYVESVRRRPLTFNGQILDRITVCAHPPRDVWGFKNKYLQEHQHALKQQHMQRPGRKYEMLTSHAIFHHDMT